MTCANQCCCQNCDVGHMDLNENIVTCPVTGKPECPKESVPLTRFDGKTVTVEEFVCPGHRDCLAGYTLAGMEVKK